MGEQTETDAVNHPTQYIGTNDTKIFDLSGHLLAEVTGTSDAVKIVP